MTRLRIAVLIGVLALGCLRQEPAHTARIWADGPTAGQQQIVAEIRSWAAWYGVGQDYLLGVAECESNLDPWAMSPTGDYGIFQWHFSGPSLWWDWTPEGQQGLMPWDVSVDRQIQLAALAFSLGYGPAWSCA